LQMFLKLRVVLVAVAALAIAGCGESGPAGKVEGTVTLDGTPLTDGSISFVPADGKAASAGGVIKDGKYSVEVHPGPKKITVNATKVVGQKVEYEGDPNSPKTDIIEEIIPARYNSKTELTFEVKEGQNEHNVALESKKKK